MTYAAMRAVSDMARSLDTAGRVAVCRFECRNERPMSSEDAADLYRRAVCCTADRAMREELAPYQAVAVRWMSLTIEPGKSIPDELQAVMDAIVAKWSEAVAEVLGPVASAPDITPRIATL